MLYWVWAMVVLWLAGCGSSPDTSDSVPTPQVQSTGSDRASSQPGYEPYNPGEVTKDWFEGRQYALFFYTSSCTDCERLDAEIQNNLENIPENITIYKTDMSAYPELAKKYNASEPNTVTIVQNKNSFTSFQWLTSLDMLLSSFGTPTISIK